MVLGKFSSFTKKDLAFFAILGSVFAFILILLTTYLITSNVAERKLKTNANFHLEQLSSSLGAILDKHKYLPKVVAKHSGLIDFLELGSAASSEDVLKVNQYLSSVNELAETSDIYLMLTNGDTVASSNWDQTVSFVGQNFAFRPYFLQAMEGRLGRYFALGTTSQARGYYFASAVKNMAGDKLLGILVVKISIGDIEKSWNKANIDFMVTDRHGVVFIASQNDWQFNSLLPLSELVIEELADTRRYANKQINPLNLIVEVKNEDHSLVLKDKKRYYMVEQSLAPAGWHIHVLMNRKEGSASIFWSLVAVSVASLLTAALILMYLQRQRERHRYQLRAREILEKKVEERTKELKLIQEELIHAGKMAALGQLSASINHELNNPLAAIRAYADNAVQFLENDKLDITKANLTKISKLTERMASITHQLKSFSRKSQGILEPVLVHKSLESSLSILKSQTSTKNISIERNETQEKVSVFGDLVWIEQILINLIKNGIDATESKDNRKLEIKVLAKGDNIVISISDNGEGLEEGQVDHIFEPFYTTKKSSKGLGLGLSISYRLAKDMQGNLTAKNLESGGATFYLTLPRNASHKRPINNE